MVRQSVSIVVWHGKAYLPVQGRFESGTWVDLEPVYVADLDPESLLSAIEKVKEAGHPSLPRPTREEMRQRKSPILAATKARSWKELARGGASYSIDWTDRGIQVSMSRLDKKGRWEWDPEKMHSCPLGTPLQKIIAVILEDIRSRPKVWQ